MMKIYCSLSTEIYTISKSHFLTHSFSSIISELEFNESIYMIKFKNVRMNANKSNEFILNFTKIILFFSRLRYMAACISPLSPYQNKISARQIPRWCLQVATLLAADLSCSCVAITI